MGWIRIKYIAGPIKYIAFAEQTKVEEEAMALYIKDPKVAKDFLTKYSNEMAKRAVERYWLLYEELWSKYTQKF